MTTIRQQIKNMGRIRISERGFSLIEMMVSITIGLMIVAALVGVLASNSRSSKTNERTAELQSNGRYALDHLKRELRHAGYRGYTWAEPALPSGAIAMTGSVTECGGAGSGFVQNIRQGIWGDNDNNPFSSDCIDSGYLRGDMLVIRRVSSQPATALAADAFYFRSTYSAGEVFQGTTTPTGITGTPIASFALQEYVYYIGSDDNDAAVPALRRVALQADGSMVDEMVVSGVEHLQMQYGITTTDLNTQYYEADAITGTSTSTSPNDWDNVHSVRIWLLSRNAKAENGYVNTNTYEMGDQSYAVNDSFRRQLFTTVVQLRN